MCSNPKLSDEKVDGLIEVNCKLKLLENLANSLELAERFAYNCNIASNVQVLLGSCETIDRDGNTEI